MSESFFEKERQKKAQETTSAKRTKTIRNQMMDELFTEQRTLIREDKSRWKSVLVPRRGGKTFAFSRYAVDKCLERKNSVVLVLTLTLKSCKRLYWDEIKELMSKKGIAFKPDKTNATFTLFNGSVIMLGGAETEADIERWRGIYADLVLVDECKSFHPTVFLELIESAIEPTLLDNLGTIVVGGTPGTDMVGPFFEATYPEFKTDTGVHRCRPYYEKDKPYWKARRPKWSLHTWTQRDNVMMPHIWRAALELKEINGWDDNHPTWLREYEGKWVQGESAWVFSYGDANARAGSDGNPLCTYYPLEESDNKFGLPNGVEWNYSLGIDLGYEDSTAFVIAAWSVDHPILYYVFSHKAPHMKVPEIAERIEMLSAMVGGFSGIVADTGGLGKLIVETLNFTHGFNIVPAQKKDKLDFIELMNSDYDTGRIKHLPGLSLSSEVLNLRFDLTRGTKSELLRAGKLRYERDAEDHLADAHMYVYRFVRHMLYEEMVEPTPEEKRLADIDEQMAKLTATEQRKDLTRWLDKKNKESGTRLVKKLKRQGLI